MVSPHVRGAKVVVVFNEFIEEQTECNMKCMCVVVEQHWVDVVEGKLKRRVVVAAGGRRRGSWSTVVDSVHGLCVGHG